MLNNHPSNHYHQSIKQYSVIVNLKKNTLINLYDIYKAYKAFSALPQQLIGFIKLLSNHNNHPRNLCPFRHLGRVIKRHLFAFFQTVNLANESLQFRFIFKCLASTLTHRARCEPWPPDCPSSPITSPPLLTTLTYS